MALPTIELELKSEQVDCSKAYINDVSAWGAPNDNRNAAANFLVVSKNTVNGTPTFLSVLNSAPLSQLEWEIPTVVDGWYQFNLLRIPIYVDGTYVPEIKDGNGVITQAASVLWHQPTGYVVKAIAGSTNVEPGDVNWQASWEVIGDLSTLISYPSIITNIHHDLIDCYLRERYRDLLEEAIAEFGCQDCSKSAAFIKADQVDTLLNGANALNWEDKSAQMEEVIVGLTQFAK